MNHSLEAAKARLIDTVLDVRRRKLITNGVWKINVDALRADTVAFVQSAWPAVEYAAEVKKNSRWYDIRSKILFWQVVSQVYQAAVTRPVPSPTED